MRIPSPNEQAEGIRRPVPIGRTVEAVMFDWELAAPHVRRPMAVLRRRVEASCAAGIHVAVVSATDVAGVDALLGARPCGPGRLWLCSDGPELVEVTAGGPRRVRTRIGEARAEGSEPVGEVVRLLDELGIGAGLILTIGVDHARLPMGTIYPNAGKMPLRAVFDEQLHRRRSRRVPAVDEDPAWTVRETGRDPMRHRITETLFTLGASGFATRGSVEEAHPGSAPLLLAAGVYRGSGQDQQLLAGPGWTGLLIAPPPEDDTRVLDLRTGVLVREESPTGTAPLRSLRFASATRPGVVALRAEASVGRLHGGDALRAPLNASATGGAIDARSWARVGADGGGAIAAVAVQRSTTDDSVKTVERVAAYVADKRRLPAIGGAVALLDIAADIGFDRLLAEHRAAWAARWGAVDVNIPDDPATQLAVRFALFQLWCNVNRHDELAVGARGLSGTGYSGHVFWDADAFVLPAMVTIDPSAARAMMRYRIARLGAAKRHARAAGHHGARFPWESASTGDDVTPSAGDLGGSLVPILTGQREEHVTADVAWAAAHYAEWQGLGGGATRPELPLLLETARYWASRCARDSDGSVHIRQVIGPDEYHECVDDNAYTNVMARWNLRAAAEAAGHASSAADEAGDWRALADRIVDGYDPATRRYEQFAGYFDLEPLMMAGFAQPPVAADLLLGRERVAGSQLIKQPDVLMLHHLVPDEVHRNSLLPNLEFYGPRTAHGSSLSPAVTASLLARAGRPDEALAMLGHALMLDLGDTTGMTAAGLHLANLGGVWLAVLGGFAGVTVRAGELIVDPCLPSSWGALGLRFHALGCSIKLSVTRDAVGIVTDAPLRVRLRGHKARTVRHTARFARRGDEGAAAS